jgi:hypothetical protein
MPLKRGTYEGIIIFLGENIVLEKYSVQYLDFFKKFRHIL